MVTPEIQQFVQQQRIAGRSIDEIRADLVKNNWSQADIDQLLSGSGGITIPKWLLVCLSGILILGIFGGGAYAYFQIRNQSQLSAPDSSSDFLSVSPSVAPSVVASASAYAIHQDKHIRFSYDSSWKVVDLKPILKVKPEVLAEDPLEDNIIPILFFSQDEWPAAEKIIDTYQKEAEPADAVAYALDEINPTLMDQAEMVYSGRFFSNDSYAPGNEMSAENWAKIYEGSVSFYSQLMVTPFPTTQIQKTQAMIVNNRKAYMVLLGSEGNGSAFLVIDGEKNETFHFIFNFKGDNIQELSPKQKIIVDSIEIL